MTYQALTPIEKRQFKKFHICPLCFREILPGDEFEFSKIKLGRSNTYTFFHISCLLNIHKHIPEYKTLSSKLAVVNNRMDIFQKGGTNV